MKTVSEVAELTGITVRTLHHYDELGLLCPSERSEAGYRRYSYDDLARLREILTWRALGFSLGDIRSLLDDPAYERLSALERQRELVRAEIARLGGLAVAVEEAIDAELAGTRLEETKMFDGFDASQYEDEVRERWGHTEAYRESARRTQGYGQPEWDEIRREGVEIVDELAGLMRAGEPATGDAARALAERHREYLSRWFYPCSPPMHRGLAEMYVTDERFKRSYERQAEGLATYFHDAIVANAGGEASAFGRHASLYGSAIRAARRGDISMPTMLIWQGQALAGGLLRFAGVVGSRARPGRVGSGRVGAPCGRSGRGAGSCRRLRRPQRAARPSTGDTEPATSTPPLCLGRGRARSPPAPQSVINPSPHPILSPHHLARLPRLHPSLLASAPPLSSSPSPTVPPLLPSPVHPLSRCDRAGSPPAPARR